MLTAAQVALVALPLVPQAAQGSRPNALAPADIFKRVAPSVVVIEALDADRRVVALGSGVVIASEKIVTNRHVLEDAVAVRVRQGSTTWPATVELLHPLYDLARLSVPRLDRPATTVRASSTLQTGDRVYSIGAPEGLELTLGEGLISSLRPYEGTHLIQTSAPISKGSSGGGLFDARGELVGVTTLSFRDGQNLNFALPGDWVKALLALPSRADVNPSIRSSSDPFAWHAAGIAAAAVSNWPKAIEAYRQAVRLKPDFAEGWYGLGWSYNEAERFADAISALRECVRLRRAYGEAWNSLAYAYHRQRDDRQADAAVREALRHNPDNASAWYNLGTFLSAQSRYGEAITAFREAVRLKTDFLHAWNNLAVAYREEKRYPDLIQVNLVVVRLEPDFWEAWLDLAYAYFHEQQHDKAITAYQETVRINPASTAAWHGLGLLYSYKGNQAGLREAYERLRSLDPQKAEEIRARMVGSNNTDGPTMEATVEWLKGRVEDDGDSIGPLGRTRKQLDLARCAATFTSLEGRTLLSRGAFQLNAISAVEVIEEPAGPLWTATYLAFRSKNPRAIRAMDVLDRAEGYRNSYRWWIGSVRSGTPNTYRETADRMAKAFVHVVSLCGGNLAAEPF